MKPVNGEEALQLEKRLQFLKASVLQNVISSERDLLTIFYKKGQVYYLWFDFSISHPVCFLFDKNPSFSQGFQAKTKPVSLFLKAHFKGLKVDSVILKSSQDRILFFHFKERFLWEFRFFSKGCNFIIKAGEKKMSWFKVKEIKKTHEGYSKTFKKPFEVRDLKSIEDEWFALKRSSTLKRVKKQDETKEKRKKALKQIKEQLLLYKDDVYKRLAYFIEKEILPKNLSLEKLPQEFLKFVDKDMTVYELLQKAYKLSKGLKGKIDRLEKRKSELEALLTKTQLTKKEKKKSDPFLQLKFKGKKKEFFHCSCWVGRSAKDNLSLLRYAKPWYFWLHLKDYPGAHGIIRRNKKQRIAQKELEEVCHFFIQHNFRSSSELKEGEKFDVLLTEVRFVQPIKGDRLGRVRYTKEKIMTIKIS